MTITSKREGKSTTHLVPAYVGNQELFVERVLELWRQV